MKPTELDDMQYENLPPYHVVVWAKQQPQYQLLSSVVFTGKEGRVLTRWTFNDAERRAIAAGEDLYLQQLTFSGRLQPILPTIGLPDFCPADPNGMLATPHGEI